MKECRVCGAQFEEDGRFCANCGAECQEADLPREDAGKTPLGAQEVQIESKPQKKSKKKVILLSAVAIVVVLSLVVGYFVLQWYNSAVQRSLRAINRGDYESAKEIMREDGTVIESDDLVEGIKNRIADIQEGFVNGSIEYSLAQMEFDQIENLGIWGVSDLLNEGRVYVHRLNQSRTDFATAEKYFERGEYSEAIKLYKRVVEADTNYETAKQKAAEAIGVYRNQILESAETYAEKDMYNAAISVLKGALEVIPGDSQISEQLALYETDRTRKEKQVALETAAAYAEKGNYLHAVVTLTKAIQMYGADTELSVAYDDYCDKYVAAALLAAEAKVTEKRHEEAIEILREGLEFIEGNTQLEGSLKIYEENYVKKIAADVQALVDQRKFDEAIRAIDTALAVVPGNAALQEQRASVEKQKPRYFLEKCEPYETSGYTSYKDGKTFSMAGEARTNGFEIQDTGYAISNLGGNFTELEFDVGHVDGTSMYSSTVSIYLDGVLHQSFVVEEESLPQHMVIPLAGVKQIKIVVADATWWPRVGFADVMIR